MDSQLLPDINREALATTLDLISDGIWDWNANTTYVYRSPGWYRMLGYDVDAFANTVFTWESVIHPEDYPRVMDHFDAYLQGRSKEYKIQYRCKMKDGSYRWIEDTARIVATNEDGSVARMIGAHRDITYEKLLETQKSQNSLSLQEIVDRQTVELRELNKKLAQKVKEVEVTASKDALTGLFNRHHFDAKLTHECARAERFNEPLSVLMLDLDNLKPINDQYGHPAGDLALSRIAHLLQNNIRQIDIPVRWGGDEFIVLLPNTPLDQARILAGKLLSLVQQLDINGMITTTISIGIAQLSPSERPSQLLQRADKALYQAKHKGGNQIASLEAGV